MITRIHGASSTLAANPPRKHRRAKAARRRKNPLHARRRNPDPVPEKKKRVYVKKGRTLAERLAYAEGLVKQLASKAADKAAKASAPKAGRKYAPSAKSIAKAMRQKQRTELGYALRALPADQKAAAYVYARFAKDKSGKKRLAGYSSFGKLIKGTKPKFTITKTSDGRLGLHKNPAIGKLVVAGVPVVNMAIGSVAAIAIGMISQKVIAKYAPSVASSPVGDITGELATAGIAAYLHGSKVLKNPMHKSIAQFAFIGAVFQILSKKATAYVGPLVDKIPGLSGYEGYTGGVYFDPYTATQAVGGMYTPVNSLGGIYASVDQSTEMGGLGLFQDRSFYG